MQKWIRLGSEVYAADQAQEGMIKMGEQIFLGPVAPVSGGVFGGSALRFSGIEGTAPAENGLTEGWLGFCDGEFPEIRLTTVLQASEGRARMRHVFTGDGDAVLAGGETLTLTALNLAEGARLYALEDGELLPVPTQEGLLPCRTLVAETASGAVLVSGGDFFALANDEEGLTLACCIRLEEDADLSQENSFATDWVEIVLGETAQAVAAVG